jgi:hypothetical protein
MGSEEVPRFWRISALGGQDPCAQRFVQRLLYLVSGRMPTLRYEYRITMLSRNSQVQYHRIW